MTEAAPEVLFAEPGASWFWLILGPFAALFMLGIEINAGIGPQLAAPAVFLVMVSGFLGIQIHAARIHTCVELTPQTLRQGTETLHIDSIVAIYPVPDNEPGTRAPKWQSTRALGELSGVPRGRTGIGLKLADKRTVQAWARRHRELRAVLTELVDQRQSESPLA